METRERLVGFVDAIVSGLPHVRQRENARLYVRGLVERGAAEESAADVVSAGGAVGAVRVGAAVFGRLAVGPGVGWCGGARSGCVPELGVEAWVLDDTGFPKQGKHSPGVKRQYSGTLGKIGNCQIGVSVHAVGERGTAPLGWALYLPEEWCEDAERRARAKIPGKVGFKTKPELGVELVEQAAGWDVAAGPGARRSGIRRQYCAARPARPGRQRLRARRRRG